MSFEATLQVDAASFSGAASGSAVPGAARPVVRGKFLFVGETKLWVRGVTYGTFRPEGDGPGFPSPEVVDRDFAAMAAHGINAVRTYEVPPRSLLDAALRHGLWVMVGLPWEQHVTFLDAPRTGRAIEERVRAGVRACAGHPAVLCYTVGNEIPAAIVRWHGRRRIEAFLRRLYRAAKAEDPAGLVTYVNFPTTEFLQLPFLDLVCVNVYLEERERLEAYLARLQNLAGERPLVMAEIGLDSRRNGAEAQARSLDWQVRSAFASGCAGTFVFAWTDEWYRGGSDIDDWDFGLTTRDRQPKPALEAVATAYRETPFAPGTRWPRISVVVCSYNGSATIRDTMEGLAALDYPDYEVIVVNDGSTDAVPQIAGEYDVRLISTENRGLSAARNTGMEAATGEIVAYIDDDAYPDPDWLHYLALVYQRPEVVAAGGPNLAPPGDGWIADCVANAPGGPVQVLLSDTVAEHVPGCNMSFRREALAAIGGFDPRYRAAGDDVDACWRIQDGGGTIGFHAAAMVWHHRRNSLSMYWRQQKGYGKAEALLEGKWPAKYNAAGHLAWGGRLYGKGITAALPARRWRVYQGAWGSAAYQSLYEPGPVTLLSLPLMPEWFLVAGALGVLSLLGLAWPPLRFVVPLFLVAVALPVAQAALAGGRASFTSGPRTLRERARLRLLTAALHLAQPAARLIGRLRHGLTPWRRHAVAGVRLPRTQVVTLWEERWRSPEARLAQVEAALLGRGLPVRRGGDFDEWDLEVRGGLLASARLTMAIEEHGGGRQLVRWRIRPRGHALGWLTTLFFAGLAVVAAMDGHGVVSALLAIPVAVLAAWGLRDASSAAVELARAAVQRRREEE